MADTMVDRGSFADPDRFSQSALTTLIVALTVTGGALQIDNLATRVAAWMGDRAVFTATSGEVKLLGVILLGFVVLFTSSKERRAREEGRDLQYRLQMLAGWMPEQFSTLFEQAASPSAEDFETFQRSLVDYLAETCDAQVALYRADGTLVHGSGDLASFGTVARRTHSWRWRVGRIRAAIPWRRPARVPGELERPFPRIGFPDQHGGSPDVAVVSKDGPVPQLPDQFLHVRAVGRVRELRAGSSAAAYLPIGNLDRSFLDVMRSNGYRMASPDYVSIRGVVVWLSLAEHLRKASS